MRVTTWLFGAAIVGSSLGAAAAPPPGAAAGAEPDGCPTIAGAAPEDTAEFDIGFDGSVRRNQVDATHRNTVRILAGDFAGERLAALKDRVTLGLSSRSSKFRDDPLGGDYRCKPGNLSVPVQLDPHPATDARQPDHWRVVIMIDRAAALAVQLGPPSARQDPTWKLIADRAVKDEATRIQQGLVQRLGVVVLPADRATAIDHVRALVPTAKEFAEAVRRIEYPVGEDAWLQLERDLALDALRAEADALHADPTAPPDKFDAAWSKATALPRAGSSPAHCNDAWQYNVMRRPNSSEVDPLGGWLFGVFELPLTSRDDTVELGATGFALPSRAIRTPGQVTAWAPSVATDDEVRFEWVIGASTQPDLAAVIGATLTVVKSGISLKTLGLSDLILSKSLEQVSEVLPAPALPPLSRGLRDLTSRASCRAKDVHAAYPLTALSGFRSVVSTSELERDHNYTVYACKGMCSTTGPALAKGQLTTPSSGGLTLIGSLSYNFRRHGGPGFSQYQWQPTTASGNTQQIFELEQVTQPLQSYALAVALAYRLPDCMAEHWLLQAGCDLHAALGFGPSIVYGDGSGHLTQWTANLFFAPGSMIKKKLYVTAGYGFRFFNQPLVAMEHDHVQSSMIPALTQRTGVQQVVMVGLAFDLTVIGDAASSVFGAKIAAPAEPGAKGAP